MWPLAATKFFSKKIANVCDLYIPYRKRYNDDKCPWTKLIIDFINKVELGLSAQSLKDIVSFTER